MAGDRAGPVGEHAWPPTAATSRRTARGWRRAGRRSLDVDRADARSRSSASDAAPAAAPSIASPGSWRRSACCTGSCAEEGMRPDDPTADVEGVRVPAGIPQPLTEAEVDRAARRRRRQRPGRAARPGAARAAVRHRGADLARLCGLSLGDLDRRRAAGAPVRQGLQGADRAVRPARRRGAGDWLGAVGRAAPGARRGGRAAATPRRCS